MMESISKEEACELQRLADLICSVSQISLICSNACWEKKGSGAWIKSALNNGYETGR